MIKRYALVALLPLTFMALAGQNKKPQNAPAPSATHPAPGGKIGAPPRVPAPAGAFLDAHCYVCHNAETKNGNLDLTALQFDTNDPKAFALWVKVHDRVQSGEMPPPEMGKIPETARAPFLRTLATPMIAADARRARQGGRAVWRRMNRYEYENTVRDLLGAPWLQIKEMLPEDGQAFRFNKVGDALDVSHVQMGRYLAAADYALREAMAQQATRPEAKVMRYYARDQRDFAKYAAQTDGAERSTFLITGGAADLPALQKKAPITVGDKDPARRELESVGVVASSYEPLNPRFNSWKAPMSGRYKIRLSAHTFWAGPLNEKSWWKPSQTNLSRGRTREPVTVYAETYPRLLRKLGNFEFGPDASVVAMDVYLLKGESISPDAVRLFRSRPPGFRNPLAQPDGQPGVAYRWMEAEGPINESWPSPGQRLLFGDLPLQIGANGALEVVPHDPDADAARLVRGFVARAYRRPVQKEEVEPFVRLVRTAQSNGMSFTDAMITAYSAVLCSPSFVTLEEKPGALDNYALASRLSYFLWNSAPDAALRNAAGRGDLTKPGGLQAQAGRLLADSRSDKFVEAFLDYWLDLRKVNNNSPDAALYPDYYLDDFLTESSLDETQAFFRELIRGDLPARNLVDSRFVMVNERLADLYELPGVKGVEIRKVSLPANSPRGGLLTQASVLKVTANGTTTSPVLRGVWINERILGQTTPPPPAAVAAVEPDTRGATTIREQLAKHRDNPSCNVCHRKIDPPGFALENFDVSGGWRDRYRALGGGERPSGQAAQTAKRGKNGQPFEFTLAKPVDASGTLPTGQKFHDIRELKRLLAQDDRQIARNLVRQFVVYSTGAPVGFSDRDEVEAILNRAKPTGYGVKSLLRATIASDLFRTK